LGFNLLIFSKPHETPRKTHLRLHGFSLLLLSKTRWLCQWFFADIPGKKQGFAF
jgi:hypothetical protein